MESKKDKHVCKTPSSADKWMYTLMTTLLFLIIVNPYTYKLVQTLLGGIVKIADIRTGCPTMAGIVVHAIVFTLLLRLMMEGK